LGGGLASDYVTILYGPKGCGKTTFFRVLSWAAHRLGLYSRGYRIILPVVLGKRGIIKIVGPKGSSTHRSCGQPL